MSITKILKTAFAIPDCELPAIRCDTLDAITGEPITRGVRVSDLITVTTAEVADTFRYGDFVAKETADLFKQSSFTSNFAVVNGIGYRPMVASASVTPERPLYQSLLENLSKGDQTIIMLTSNTKRRLWPLAVESAVGQYWRITLVDGDDEGVFEMPYSEFVSTLQFVRDCLNAGYSKAAMRETLTRSKTKESLADLITRDRELTRIRQLSAFLPALFVAQKDT